MIIDMPDIADISYTLLSYQFCTLKQIDLTSIFTIQLPYYVTVLCLTSKCKLAPAQYTHKQTSLLFGAFAKSFKKTN